jgi:hypothetical protein
VTTLTEERKGKIGGSDIGSLFGRGFASVVELFLEKTGALKRKQDTRMGWGNRLELLVARDYAAQTGAELLPPSYKHPLPDGIPDWVTLHPDRFAYVDGELRGVEIKTHTNRPDGYGEPGTDQVPAKVQLQCQWYMHWLLVKRWDAAIQIGFGPLRVYHLHYNFRLGCLAEAKAHSFVFDHLRPGIAPDPESSWEASQVYREPVKGILVETEDDITEAVDMHAAHRVQESTHKKLAEGYELTIKKYMNDCGEKLIHPATGEVLVTWIKGKTGSRLFLNKRTALLKRKLQEEKETDD